MTDATETTETKTTAAPSALALSLENALREVDRLTAVVADREQTIARAASAQAELEAGVADLVRVAMHHGFKGGDALSVWLTQQLGRAGELAEAVEAAVPIAVTHHDSVRLAERAWHHIVRTCREFRGAP